MAANINIFNIIWQNITDNLIPWFWRDTSGFGLKVKNPTWLPAYMNAVVSPLEDITDELFELMFDIQEKVKFDSRVQIMTIQLNDLYDPIQRRIFYEDDFGVTNFYYTMFLEAEGQPAPFDLYQEGEINPTPVSLNVGTMAAGDVDFTIVIPAGIADTTLLQMRSTIDRFKPAGKRYLIVDENGLSPEVAVVINNLPDILSGNFANALAIFVDAEVRNGNWQFYDDFWLFTTAEGFTELNSLTGWKAATTAQNFGATLGATGFDFDGVADYVNSNYIPAAPLNIWDIDNGFFNVYLYQNDVAAGDAVAALIGSDKNNQESSVIKHSPTGQTTFGMNGDNVVAAVAMPTNQNVSSRRINANDIQLFHDGVQVATLSDVSRKQSTLDTYIGANNQADIAVEFFDGIITSVTVGAGAGMDIASHNANVKDLLSLLGII